MICGNILLLKLTENASRNTIHCNASSKITQLIRCYCCELPTNVENNHLLSAFVFPFMWIFFIHTQIITYVLNGIFSYFNGFWLEVRMVESYERGFYGFTAIEFMPFLPPNDRSCAKKLKQCF